MEENENMEEVVDEEAMAAFLDPKVPVAEDTTEEEDIQNENYDDSDGYVKAKTFPIDESWPEEMKEQVRQLNQMAEIINAEPEDDPEYDEDVNDEEDIDDEVSEDTTPAVAVNETQTFDNIF